MDEIIQLDRLPQRLLTAIEVVKLLNIGRAFAYRLMTRGSCRR
jgi:predicted DNA-binding transcriptional regulator AlpA